MRVVGRFHGILSTGDTTGLDALLAPDLKVLEGGVSRKSPGISFPSPFRGHRVRQSRERKENFDLVYV